ncbi:hypothetical protein R3W88_031818 [Solanum pinnatisectum]|uniref:Uncharacterized protein n=1 Tax=Solanum pinnatisectum TaxID=50273 RepID=A0AAV9LME5_9SOLN|nr:hypothetical protein R3W88_031818 [Solanum pinnatisectum]
MSSIASDPCDYDMGEYDCDDEAYGCEDNGDYGGYDDSHDQEPNENESYYFRGEYEKNVEQDSYGEDREEEGSCGSSYDDEGAYERSYSHSEIEGGSYDDAGECYTSHSQDEGKDVSRVSIPKGLNFLSLRDGVIPRHILIGSGNVSRFSNVMI